MAFPVRDVVQPAVLSGRPNGRLPDSILVDTPGRQGGPTVRLVAPAARAWRALTAAALDAGHVLKASGPADSYRSFANQESTFRARYTTDVLPGRPTRRWQGETWFQRPRTAVAAVPGTSNHGRGIAVDTGEERDDDRDADPLDDATLAWLLRNEERFGWSHEIQSEPWHIRYFAGDNPPAAVRGFQEDDMASTWLQPLTQGNPGFAGHLRDTALAFAWQHAAGAHEGVRELLAALKADEVRDKAVQAAIEALAAGQAADPQKVLEAINVVRDEARGQFAELLDAVARAETQVVAAEDEITLLKARLAALGEPV